MRPRNPALIFAEDHYDAITAKVMNRLLEKLKQSGYRNFYDEVPTKDTLQDCIDFNEELERDYFLLGQEFEKLGFSKSDFTDEDVLEKFVLKKLLSQLDVMTARNRLSEVSRAMCGLIKRHDARVAFQEFLKKLQSDGIEFTGVDIETEKFKTTEILAMDGKREKFMAENYLKAAHPFFGRTGLAHVQNMQREIKSKLSDEEASQSFCFINVYAKPPISGDDELEKRVRNHEVDYPLGLIVVDAQNKTVEEAADEVWQKITNQFPQLKMKPSMAETMTLGFLYKEDKYKNPSFTYIIDKLPRYN